MATAAGMRCRLTHVRISHHASSWREDTMHEIVPLLYAYCIFRNVGKVGLTSE